MPAVVNIYISPAVVDEAFFYHGPGALAYILVGDGTAPAVPAVPAHRRGEADFIADLKTKHSLGRALIISGDELDIIGAGSVNNAGNVAGGAIEFEPGRKALGGESHRARAGGWNGKHEW